MLLKFTFTIKFVWANPFITNPWTSHATVFYWGSFLAIHSLSSRRTLKTADFSYNVVIIFFCISWEFKNAFDFSEDVLLLKRLADTYDTVNAVVTEKRQWKQLTWKVQTKGIVRSFTYNNVALQLLIYFH